VPATITLYAIKDLKGEERRQVLSIQKKTVQRSKQNEN
jgi:hypothetical protein